MAIGSRKSKKKSSVGEARRRSAINYIAGVTEAAFLAAMADGELSDNEYEALVNIVSNLFDGQVTEDQINEILEACEEALENEGFEARMDNIAAKLPNVEAAAVALYAVAGVVLGDDEYDADNEGSFYDDFAAKVGAPEEVAAEIWNETAEAFGWS